MVKKDSIIKQQTKLTIFYLTLINKLFFNLIYSNDDQYVISKHILPEIAGINLVLKIIGTSTLVWLAAHVRLPPQKFDTHQMADHKNQPQFIILMEWTKAQHFVVFYDKNVRI